MEDLIVATNPKSSFAEAIKLIKTNVTFSSIGTGFKTILMTSPESGDGKSFLIANLASAFAQEGKQVLIIDADLRRGRQHKIFKVERENAFGYSNLILNIAQNQEKNTTNAKNDKEILSYAKDTNVRGVKLIPAGPTPPNPLELLSSDTNRYIIERLKEKFDVIFIDCPPALGLSDALVASKYSDVNIVVISNAKTTIDQLESVKKNFARVNSKITGVVINRAKVKKSSYSSYYTNDKYYTDNNIKK
ncbi:CpsD/CapB family tyrosine-protein kinase [Candidatus Saccharibacteria bacterium]|nr:CpsD/CapB family tyrosine-protein kinase [Candidatus Saccharibacteria bacterium]